MEAVKQPRDENYEPLNVADDDSDTDSSARVRFQSGAFVEIMRCAKEHPLEFSFNWKGAVFTGKVESVGNSMRLSLRSSLAALPFSAESTTTRSDLLAVVDTCSDGNEAKLMIYQGRTVMLEHTITLPSTLDDTVATIVTHLTVLVLNTAPYLDLIAEFMATQADKRA